MVVEVQEVVVITFKKVQKVLIVFFLQLLVRVAVVAKLTLMVQKMEVQVLVVSITL